MKLENKMNETPEKVFFKYAYPCGSDLLQLGLIDQTDFSKLEQYKKSGEIPERDILEKLYVNAFKRIDAVASSIGKSRWDVDSIRRYFLVEHNNIIDREKGLYKDAHHTIKDLCKVRIGIVKKKESRNGTLVYSIDYGEHVEVAVGNDLPNVEIGERISTHWGFVVEKISDEVYEKYGA